ncbi:MAG: hypothetical protein AAGI46_02535 [Planctomycetota bacterium]
MHGPPRRGVIRWIMTIVLLVTPLFAVVDFGFGNNLRAPGLETLGVSVSWKVVYYVGITGLGVLALWLPAAAAPLSVLEAGANVIVAVLMVVLPYDQLLDNAHSGGPLVVPDLPLTAMFISAGVGTLSLMSFRSKGFLGHDRGSALTDIRQAIGDR